MGDLTTTSATMRGRRIIVLFICLFPLIACYPSSYTSYRALSKADDSIPRFRRDFKPFEPFQMQSINFSDSSLPSPDWNPASNLKKGGFSSSVSQSHASFTDKKNPNLSIGDSLAIDININGPLGNMDSEFHGNQNFGKGVKTDSKAKGGSVNGTSVALTATKADITGVDPNAEGSAVSINKANVIMSGNAAANAAAQGSVNTRRPGAALKATVIPFVVVVETTPVPLQKAEPRPTTTLKATTFPAKTTTTTTTTTTTISIADDTAAPDGDDDTTTTPVPDDDSEEDRPRRHRRRRPPPRPEFPGRFGPQPAFGTFATPGGFNNMRPNNFNGFDGFG